MLKLINNYFFLPVLQIHFPGISKECFLALREFLYTDDLVPEGHIDCLGIIAVGNQFCLPRLVKLVESSVVEDLVIGESEGEDIMEEALHIIEPAQVTVWLTLNIGMPKLIVRRPKYLYKHS